MNLIFDIGNTSTKIAFFDGSQKITSIRTRQFSCEKMDKIFAPYRNKFERAIISTVKDLPQFIIDLATLGIPVVHILGYESKLPFVNEYETPETLGPDRIASVAGACRAFPGEKVLIIDAGSAVTYDYLFSETYKGGNISPGLTMRFKALHKFTGRLPLCTTTEKYNTPGKNTVEAITAGVISGLISEIKNYIKEFKEMNPGGRIILTGGDSGYLKERITEEIFYMPDIVLEGLNYILELNA